MRTGVIPKGSADVALKLMFPEPNLYADDPVGWVNTRLGDFTWSKQIEILESVRDNRFTAVKACHGPGKSFTAARCVAWWEDVHPLGSAFSVTTAPTWPQIEAILWRELRRAHSRGKLPGRITMDCKWQMGTTGKKLESDEELVAMGRKPADYDEQAFQGIHARYVLVVIDEACGVPKQLFDAAESLVTNDRSRVLAIGNPDDPGSHFADICKAGSGWNVITISAFDTPNFTGEYCPEDVADQLTSKLWVEERRRKWGEGSMLWTSKVLGEFPDISDDNLVSPKMLADAHSLDLPGLEAGRYAADIARFGDDQSALYRNRGGQIRMVEIWAKKDTMASAGHIIKHLQGHNPDKVPCLIDVIGLGGGVYDRLREQQMPVSPFDGAARAYNPTKFKNRRAEQYWMLRKLMEENLIDLDSGDEELSSQLGSIKWGLDSSGRVFIESKEDMKKRGFPSPDRADTVMMSTSSLVDMLNSLLTTVNTAPTMTGDLLTREL